MAPGNTYRLITIGFYRYSFGCLFVANKVPHRIDMMIIRYQYGMSYIICHIQAELDTQLNIDEPVYKQVLKSIEPSHLTSH